MNERELEEKSIQYFLPPSDNGRSALKYIAKAEDGNIGFEGFTTIEAVRYLKGIYSNFNRFKYKYVEEILGPPVVVNGVILKEKYLYPLMTEMLELYPQVEPFSYKEAFEIKNDQFRANVFSSIDIREMVKNLGYTVHKTDGRLVKYKTWDENGNETGINEKHSVVEVLKVNLSQLGGLEGSFGYAIRVWCTTTDKDAIIWIDEKYKDDPLEALASTLHIPSHYDGKISGIYRQGDMFVFTFINDEMPEVPADGKVTYRPATKEEYFNLMIAES